MVVRDRIELSTFRFSDVTEPSLTVAGSRLTGHLPAPTVPGRRPASLGVCLRWLPVWLPDPASGYSKRRVIGLHIYSLADSAIRKALLSVSVRRIWLRGYLEQLLIIGQSKTRELQLSTN